MTRITASPGGASSVVLGSYGIEPLKTNGTAPAPAPPPAQAIVDAPAVVETPAGAGEFEALKLQVRGLGYDPPLAGSVATPL